MAISITIYHGSTQIVDKPEKSKGKINNDYGQGFYCTQNYKLACEWAAKIENTQGYVNTYSLDMSTLKVLDLSKKKYNILNWLTILLKNRTFTLTSQISIEAKNYLLENFYIDTTEYDVIIGYRADDSYFSFAEDFLNNTISVEKLNEAMKLGKLGIQIALMSDKAFDSIKFEKSEPVESLYYGKYISRDLKARDDYKQSKTAVSKGLFILDIIREEIKNDDARIRQSI